MRGVRLRGVFESFWFAPAVLGVLAVVLAEVLLYVDRTWVEALSDGGPWFFDSLSPSGGRALLTTVGGSMLGVAATSFSITISVLATTSSTYGPRLVRNFMADRGNQLVLAVLTSSFVYCLVVLRAVRSETEADGAFVPVVAVNAAMLVAALDVAVLVYFIHHIASSVQVTTLQARVGDELTRALDQCFPEQAPDRTAGESEAVRVVERSCQHALAAPATGWVTGMDVAALVRRAAAADVAVRVVAAPGAHVVRGERLALLSSSLDGSTTGRLAGCFDLGPARTPHQDVGFALQQLTEIAIRGLASGTNDPYTAVGAIDALGGALVVLGSRPRPPAAHLDADGAVRVILRGPTPAELLVPVLDDLREYGGTRLAVVLATLRLGERTLGATSDDAVADVVRGRLQLLVETYERGGPAELDRRRVTDRWREAIA